MTTAEHLVEVVTAACKLNDDELRVLALVAKRLGAGREAYGAMNLAGDRRDMRKEAGEEAIDLAVYLAMDLLRAQNPADDESRSEPFLDAKKLEETQRTMAPVLERPPAGEKHCPKCDTTKMLEDFPRDRSRSDGRAGKCKACNTAANKAWRETETARRKAAKAAAPAGAEELLEAPAPVPPPSPAAPATESAPAPAEPPRRGRPPKSKWRCPLMNARGAPCNAQVVEADMVQHLVEEHGKNPLPSQARLFFVPVGKEAA